MSQAVTVAADLLVAVLLVATIATSVRLSRRLALLKADESAMRSTIGELLAATDSAERAIAALRATVQDSDRTLADRLAAAARHSSALADQVSAGETVISRVADIAAMSARLGEPAAAPAPAPREGLRHTMAAAREIAARAARRIEERAA